MIPFWLCTYTVLFFQLKVLDVFNFYDVADVKQIDLKGEIDSRCLRHMYVAYEIHFGWETIRMSLSSTLSNI